MEAFRDMYLLRPKINKCPLKFTPQLNRTELCCSTLLARINWPLIVLETTIKWRRVVRWVSTKNKQRKGQVFRNWRKKLLDSKIRQKRLISSLNSLCKATQISLWGLVVAKRCQDHSLRLIWWIRSKIDWEKLIRQTIFKQKRTFSSSKAICKPSRYNRNR